MLALLGAALTAPVALAKPTAAAQGDLRRDTVSLQSLPTDAQRTAQLIRSGGPFPYGKDGSVFGNRERQLPSRPRGQYREYTVRTPGSRDRGARRIVCGGLPPETPDVCYYTGDHYNSFQRIVKQ